MPTYRSKWPGEKFPRFRKANADPESTLQELLDVDDGEVVGTAVDEETAAQWAAANALICAIHLAIGARGLYTSRDEDWRALGALKDALAQTEPQ